MIEHWIDNLAKIWRISAGRFGTVHSYLLIEKADFPDSIDASTLATQPVALTIPAWMNPKYSAGGPKIGYYKGITQFHVAPSNDMKLVPSLMPWFGMIVRAAAANVTLGHTVESFLIEDRDDAITGPIALQYGSEAVHWGFLVHWVVKEHPLAGLTTVSA